MKIDRVIQVTIYDRCKRDASPTEDVYIAECYTCGADVCSDCSAEVSVDKLTPARIVCLKHLPKELRKEA